MILADFHVHSNFCDGKNSVEELVLSAIEKNVKKLGVVVHSYIDFEPTGSATLDSSKHFINTVDRLKSKYRDKIELFCGIEQDLFSQKQDLAFDYVIGSVHFFKSCNEYDPIDVSEESFCAGVDRFFKGDYYSAVEWYYEAVIKVVEKFKPNIIGHFDLITKFNEKDKLFDTSNLRYVLAYQKAVDTLLNYDIPFEINLGAISRGYRTEPYPSTDIIEYIKLKGGRFILSSDAHDKDNICYKFNEWQHLVK